VVDGRRIDGMLCERMDARARLAATGGAGVVGDEYGEPMGVRRPNEGGRFGLRGLGMGRVGTGLMGGGALEQRRVRRNLSGAAQQRCLPSGCE
jgi:hypothetical protein